MADLRTRERIIELIHDMRQRTVANGCTPGEAAKFAAKVAEWVEKYQIDAAEVKGTLDADEIEVCENLLRTGKKAFNPGMTEVVAGLARGMCCQVILLHKWNPEGKFSEAVYGIIGDTLDADNVCQVAITVVSALKMMATLDGIEHGHEKGSLIRWNNEYLSGAGMEIKNRLLAERKARHNVKALEHATSCTALVLVTGETLAIEKKEAVDSTFKQLYPRAKNVTSHREYNDTARQKGREAGKRVGLHIGIE